VTDGIGDPGGFGERGIEGMIAARGSSRRQSRASVCLGLQSWSSVGRNMRGWTRQNSREFKPRPPTVIDLMEEQVNVVNGGTMRLGRTPC